MDTVPDQKVFSNKLRVTFPLLADIDGKICDAFKVVHPDNKASCAHRSQPHQDSSLPQQLRRRQRDLQVDHIPSS